MNQRWVSCQESRRGGTCGKLCLKTGHHHHSHFNRKYDDEPANCWGILFSDKLVCRRQLLASLWQLNSWLRCQWCSFSGSLKAGRFDGQPCSFSGSLKALGMFLTTICPLFVFFWSSKTQKGPGETGSRRWSPNFKVSPSKDVDHLVPSGSSDSWNSGRTRKFWKAKGEEVHAEICMMNLKDVRHVLFCFFPVWIYIIYIYM